MAVCVACEKPLTLLVDEEDDNEDLHRTGVNSSKDSYVDDDVQLRCSCHFHWQCLLDTSYELASCPNCNASILSFDSTGNPQLLCNLKNEGGFQEGLDILPILTEESYLKAYPEERKPRAFLEFCAEGDIPAIIGIIGDDEPDEDDERMATSSVTLDHKDILRYQDSVGSLRSGLHVAIQNQRTEVAWLLLLLASNVDYSAFPDEVKSASDGFGVTRGDQTGRIDIRALKDAEGMTAYDRAKSMGGVWESWVEEGNFHQQPLLKIL